MIRDNEVLAKARQIYGPHKQLAVSIEELGELVAVLPKYFRYDSREKAVEQLYDKVLDEYVDVYIILEHIRNIFEITDEDFNQRVAGKIERMHRWLDASGSMEQTFIDREVKTNN